jgi:hypothetical protein
MTIRAQAIIAARRRSPAAAVTFSGATRGTVQGGTAWGWDDLDRLHVQWSDYARLGLTFVRFDLDWANVQPTNATTYDWSTFDRLIDGMVSHGLKPLPIVNRAPAWATTSVTDSFGVTRQTSYPANMAQFATFCAAAVSRYKDRVKHWEIWNEPNLSGSWFPTPSVVQFSNMLKAAYPAIKGADPTAVVISGGLSPAPADDVDPITAQHPYPAHKGEIGFVQGIYSNGAGGSFDHMGIHPYSWPLQPSNPATYNGWQMMSVTTPSVRSVMVANGDSAKQIWMTEMGGPTGNGPGAVTEADQASMLVEAHQLAAGYSWAGPLIWYEYWDQSTNLGNTEENFGIVRNDYSPKPSYNAYLHLKSPGLTASSVTLRQGVNGYTSTVDTYLIQTAPTSTHGSDTTLLFGGDLNGNGTNQKAQALVRFDSLFGAGANQIPLGATIVAAELRVTVTVAGHGPSVHRMLTSWTATDTWNSRTNGIARDDVEAANTPLRSDYWLDPGTPRFNVTADVAAWSAGAANNGWLLESSGWVTGTISSAEGTAPPQLLVTYVA